MHVRFSTTNGDLACLDGALSRRGMARIGVAAEVFPISLPQRKRRKNGGQSSTLTPAMSKPDSGCSILQNFRQQISHPPFVVTLPNNTLLFRAQGLQVGVVKPDNSVELHDIKVGRDFGTTIEIVRGVTSSDKVILNPADSLVTGAVVRVATTAAASSSPAMAKK